MRHCSAGYARGDTETVWGFRHRKCPQCTCTQALTSSRTGAKIGGSTHTRAAPAGPGPTLALPPPTAQGDANIVSLTTYPPDMLVIDGQFMFCPVRKAGTSGFELLAESATGVEPGTLQGFLQWSKSNKRTSMADQPRGGASDGMMSMTVVRNPWDRVASACKDLDACPGRSNPPSRKPSLLGAAHRLTRSRDCVALSPTPAQTTTSWPTATGASSPPHR